MTVIILIIKSHLKQRCGEFPGWSHTDRECNFPLVPDNFRYKTFHELCLRNWPWVAIFCRQIPCFLQSVWGSEHSIGAFVVTFCVRYLFTSKFKAHWRGYLLPVLFMTFLEFQFLKLRQVFLLDLLSDYLMGMPQVFCNVAHLCSKASAR